MSETSIRAQYKYKTLSQVSAACRVNGLSSLGSKDQMIERLVQHELQKHRGSGSSGIGAASTGGQSEASVRAKYAAMTLMQVHSECTKAGVSTYGTKDQMIARLVAKQKPATGWATSSSTAAPTLASPTSGQTEAQVKGKYLAMTMMQVRMECTKKGVSQIGTKDQMIQRLVEKEKPAGGWPGSSSSPYRSSSTYTSPSSAARTGPSEAEVKRKYQAMTLMEVRRACTQKGLSQMGTKEQMIANLVDKEKPASGWAGISSSTGTTGSSASSNRRQYTVKLAAKVRSGFETSSADLGVAHVGDIITEIESRVNSQGITRVHYDRGWLSMKTADGRPILEPHYSPSVSSVSSAVSAEKAEALVKGKYLAMSLLQIRNACAAKGLSQLGVRDDMVRRLVESEKPPGGWGSDALPALSTAAADDAVSRVVASGTGWGQNNSMETQGTGGAIDSRHGSVQQSTRRVAFDDPAPRGPIVGDAFSRARDAATKARRRRGPSGWEEEVAEVLNGQCPYLPAGLAAELLHALEFASLPVDGLLDGDGEEADWNSAQAVLHDLPCSTGGLVAVRLLRNLCSARATFCEGVLDEGGRVWEVLLPFLCWCSFQHPRAETVGTSPAKDDGRLWVTQLLEHLSAVGAEVVGSLTWVYFWLVEVLDRAMSSSDLRLTAAAVGLLRNLMLDSTNCRRVFAMPQGQPFIAQLLPAALNVISPLGLLRFGDIARHQEGAITPHTPQPFVAAEHLAGQQAVATAAATDGLAEVANRVSARIQERRRKLRDDYITATQGQKQLPDGQVGSFDTGTQIELSVGDEEKLSTIEEQDKELCELRREIADAQARYATESIGTATGIDVAVELSMKPAPVGMVSAKVLYNGHSSSAAEVSDGTISMPVGVGVEGGGLPVGEHGAMLAWQGGVAAPAVEANFSPKQPVPVMILEVIERWSEVGAPYIVDCRIPGCGCTEGLHNATATNTCCTLSGLLHLLDARRIPTAVPTLLRRGLVLGAHRTLAVLLTEAGPRAMHALLMQMDPQAASIELGNSAPTNWATMSEGVAFGRPANAPKTTATMLGDFKDPSGKKDCHDDWQEHYDWLRKAVSAGSAEFRSAIAAIIWEVISIQSEHYIDDDGYSLDGTEEGAADIPRPSPVLDTLVALSNDVCYSCKTKTLRIGHELLKPADCPSDTELKEWHGQPGEERLVRHGDGEDAEIQRRVYDGITGKWDRVCAAPLCWKLFLRGKNVADPPPQAAYREVGPGTGASRKNAHAVSLQA